MKKKIEEFYSSKGLHINKLIKRRPRGITPGQVKAAAERYFHKYQDGYRPEKELLTALEVWNIAEDIDYEQYTKREALIDRTEKIEQENATMKTWLIFLCVIMYFLSAITLLNEVWGINIWHFLNAP